MKRLLGLCLFLAAGPAARADEPSLVVDVDVAGLSLTLPLAGEHACASAQTVRGAIDYEVKVCREGGEPAAPVLSFEVGRDQKVGDAVQRERFRATTRVAAGKRAVIARVSAADGSKTEITAGVRM
jgi:hypothetical protein